MWVQGAGWVIFCTPEVYDVVRPQYPCYIHVIPLREADMVLESVT